MHSNFNIIHYGNHSTTGLKAVVSVAILTATIVLSVMCFSEKSLADKYINIAPGWDTPEYGPKPGRPSSPQSSPPPVVTEHPDAVAPPRTHCCCTEYCSKASDGKKTASCFNIMTTRTCSDMSGHCVDDADCYPYYNRDRVYKPE